ncbi:MAG: cysteine desulfurase [Myxococcota bacterium]|jgi:cysteine desulfurase|nr:cysteine desulfurase [Myxococcota bacterium]
MSIYLDHNATTPVDPSVTAAMARASTEVFGNPSSLHSLGQKARLALHEARSQVARILKAEPEDILFTASGSEADNLAISGVLGRSDKPFSRVVTTGLEHPAVLLTCDAWSERGFEIIRVMPRACGVVAPEDFEKALAGQPALVSVMLASNETGAIQKVADIAAISHAHGCIVHCDAVQAVGKIDVDVQALGVDLLAVSAHKLYGPKGIGALYVRPGTRLSPILYGGGQERALRPGTEAVPLAVGFGLACELSQTRLQEDAARISELRAHLETRALAELPEVRINAGEAPRLPGTSSLALRGALGDSLMMALDLRGIAVSTGSACHAARGEAPSALEAMGVPPEWSRGTVRISLGRTTSREDIDRALEALLEARKRLRTGGRT